MSADLLRAIVAGAARSASERERRLDRADFERALERARPNGDRFAASLGTEGIRVIAECKRRSPSRGVLRKEYDPAEIAKGYEAAGAAAISVLTESAFFDGALEHLRDVGAAVDLPILRKDFVVTEFQVREAAVAGADAVLLIVAALDTAQLGRLINLASAIGLAALVEVHDREELTRALDAGARIVGVNSRNLRTLGVSTTVFEDLGEKIPRSVAAVAESGLKSHDDLRRLHDARYDAFLVGEHLMLAPDPGAALRSLLTGPEVREAAR